MAMLPNTAVTLAEGMVPTPTPMSSPAKEVMTQMWKSPSCAAVLLRYYYKLATVEQKIVESTCTSAAAKTSGFFFLWQNSLPPIP